MGLREQVAFVPVGTTFSAKQKAIHGVEGTLDFMMVTAGTPP